MTHPKTYAWLRAIQSIFLGIWLGAMVMLAIAAMTTFQVIRQPPPEVRVSVAFDAGYDMASETNHPQNMLAGAVVGGMIQHLRVLQWLCAIVVMVTFTAEYMVFGRKKSANRRSWGQFMRIGLLVLPIGLLALDQWSISPQLRQQREMMYDVTLQPTTRGKARIAFERYHTFSERSAGVVIVTLTAALGLTVGLTASGRNENADSNRIGITGETAES